MPSKMWTTRYGSLVLTLMILLNVSSIEETIAGATEAARRLNIMSQTYDTKLRPDADGPPINVSVQIAIVAFGPVDEKRFTFKADIFLRQTWNDPRLTILGNDSLNYNGDPSGVIWVADTYFPNARDSKSTKTLTPNIRTKLGPDGKVLISSRLNVECACVMDLNLYPMDVQECSMLMESYSYSGKDVYLKWPEEEPIEVVSGGLHLSGYEVIEVKKDYIVRVYADKETFPLLKATFKVRRTFSYYLFRIYFPTSLLVVLTWATFWIPDKAVPARITLIVTNFLSTMFILQSAASNIPKVPYTTALEVYLFTNVLFIIAVMVEYMLVLNFCLKREAPIDDVKDEMELRQLNGNEKLMVTSNTRYGCRCTQFKICQLLFNNNCHIVDAISRIGFPVIYVIFVISYFSHYSVKVSKAN